MVFKVFSVRHVHVLSLFLLPSFSIMVSKDLCEYSQLKYPVKYHWRETYSTAQ